MGKNTFKTLFLLSAVCGLSMAASGCKTNADDDPLADSSSSASSSGSSGYAVGTVNSAGFYVQVLTDNASASNYFHEQSQNPLVPGASSCIVTQATPATSAAADIVCILDMSELDLYTTEISLNFNAPAGMCNYTYVSPYAFYENEPGYPSSTGTTNIAVTTTGGVVTAAAVTDAGTNLSSQHVGVDDGGSPICKWNYGSFVDGGPSCCVGRYSLSVDDGTSTTTTTGNFGGTISSCLNGPAKDSQTPDSAGNPRSTLYVTGSSGVNQNYVITSPWRKNYSTILYNGNFFNPWDLSNAAGAVDANAGAVTAFPTIAAATPNPLRNGLGGNGAQIAAQPYYEFGCWDAARDYKARIRVLIRSWDTVSGWTAFSNPYDGTNEPNNFGSYHDTSQWVDISGNPTNGATITARSLVTLGYDWEAQLEPLTRAATTATTTGYPIKGLW